MYNSSKIDSGADHIGENGVGLKQGCKLLFENGLICCCLRFVLCCICVLFYHTMRYIMSSPPLTVYVTLYTMIGHININTGATLSDLSFVLVKNEKEGFVELGMIAEQLQRPEGC